METAKITISGTVARVHDFVGFTKDWDEILIPVDRETIKALIEQGYTIEYDSDEI